jgi:tetratricopeptide (TPR) repeat protein
MPTRSRTHVIEDIADAHFALAMQPRWIVRKKDKDYGVDLEAELLTDDGTPTGQLFYVQSKATDNEESAQSIQVKSDRIRYLTSFEVPAMIVRYSVPSNSLYWMWATEAQTYIQPGAETVTLKFSDTHRWTEDTLAEIERTIPIVRTLRRSDYRTAFDLRLANSATPAQAIQYQRIIDQLATNLPFLRTGMSVVPIVFSVEGTRVSMSAERVFSFGVDSRSDEFDHLTTASLYLFVELLHSLDQHAQALQAAKLCLHQGKQAPSDYLAGIAAVALLEDSEAAIDLAILNDLHKEQGFGHNILRMVLMSPYNRYQISGPAVHRFYENSIRAHESKGQQIGAIRYSYANYLVSSGKYALAIRQYNLARRDEPEYLRLGYYQSELGGLLFRRGRFRASVKAYRCAVKAEDMDQTCFRLGDAELYAGYFEAAIDTFKKTSSEDQSINAESGLKSALASWALANKVDSIGSLPMMLASRAKAASDGESNGLFWAHLAITFFHEDDVPCWADAIYLALMLKNSSLLRDVMIVSAQRTRLESYAKFKLDRQAGLKQVSGLIDELDQLALDLKE